MWNIVVCPGVIIRSNFSVKTLTQHNQKRAEQSARDNNHKTNISVSACHTLSHNIWNGPAHYRIKVKLDQIWRQCACQSGKVAILIVLCDWSRDHLVWLQKGRIRLWSHLVRSDSEWAGDKKCHPLFYNHSRQFTTQSSVIGSSGPTISLRLPLETFRSTGTCLQIFTTALQIKLTTS